MSRAVRINTVQRSIEILIGRLVTDGDFRRFYLNDPRTTLQLADEWGLHLSEREINALVATEHTVWERVASELETGLRKAMRQ